MPTTTRLLPLSASPLGTPILIGVSADPGLTLHQVSASANDIDRITIKLHNLSAAPLTFSVKMAGLTFIFRDIPSQAAEYVVIDGEPLVGAATPTVVTGWGASPNNFFVTGHVIRVTQT